MTRKKLFILSLIGFLLIPVYWVASSTNERYQVAAKAEILFNEIPTYPGATPVEKSSSFYNIGYGYTYKVNDDYLKVHEYYQNSLSKKWVVESKPDTSNSRSIIFSNSDNELKLLIRVWKIDNQPLTSAPYDLTISVYKP